MDLVIGDLHVQPNNLAETEKLLSFIKDTFIANKCDQLIFLGDLTHTHAIMRQEVGHLLVKFFNDMYYNVVNEQSERLIILAGNHDGISPSITHQNALQLLLPNVAVIVSYGVYIDFKKNYAFAPFIHDNESFTRIVNDAYLEMLTRGNTKDTPVLFCHQTFDGAAYETGLPCPGGVNSKDIKFEQIIAGHIHTRQVINDKVVYIGTPRAVTAAEANQSKYICGIDRTENQSIQFTDFCTKDIVKNYIVLEINEANPATLEVISTLPHNDFKKDDVRVRIIGSQTFFDEYAQKCKSVNSGIKVIPVIKKDLTKKVNLEVTNDSIEVALKKFVWNVADLDQNMREEVWKVIQEMPH